MQKKKRKRKLSEFLVATTNQFRLFSNFSIQRTWIEDWNLNKNEMTIVAILSNDHFLHNARIKCVNSMREILSLPTEDTPWSEKGFKNSMRNRKKSMAVTEEAEYHAQESWDVRATWIIYTCTYVLFYSWYNIAWSQLHIIGGKKKKKCCVGVNHSAI